MNCAICDEPSDHWVCDECAGLGYRIEDPDPLTLDECPVLRAFRENP